MQEREREKRKLTKLDLVVSYGFVLFSGKKFLVEGEREKKTIRRATSYSSRLGFLSLSLFRFPLSSNAFVCPSRSMNISYSRITEEINMTTCFISSPKKQREEEEKRICHSLL